VPPVAYIDERRGYLLALARIFLGVLFLETWVENLVKGLYWTKGYADFIRNYADKNVLPLYPTILDKVVIPHAAFFSKAQMLAELIVIGLFLLVGFLTPVAGVVAGLFGLNLLLATRGTGDWWGTYALLLVLAFLVGLAQAGRTWGIDARLADRDPRPRLPVY
jgi:uncharacterized membrane protein YphA (DoxX/SURF4 family)